MNVKPRQLTCYIKKTQSDPETWEGFCVDIDVPAIGDSYEDVVSALYEAVDNYINYVYERQPEDEQLLLYRPMSGGDAFKLMIQERILQHLPFSKLQVRKVFINAAKGLPAQLDPQYTQLCFVCRKYRDVGLFDLYQSSNTSYAWYDTACHLCKQAGKA